MKLTRQSLVFRNRSRLAVVLFILTTTISIPSYMNVLWAQAPTTKEAAKGVDSARTDAVGDPLPDSALMRLGTVRFHPGSGVIELALSPDGKTVVSWGEKVIAWDSATGRQRWSSVKDSSFLEDGSARYGALPVVFSRDNSRLFTIQNLNQIRIWDMAGGTSSSLDIQSGTKEAQKNGGMTLALDVRPDEKSFALGRADRLIVCNSKGDVLYEIPNDPKKLQSRDGDDRLMFAGEYTFGKFSPDGTQLAVVTSHEPDQIVLYNAITGVEQLRLKLLSKLVRMAFSPDGQQIVTTERDSAVRLYNVQSGAGLWSHVIPLNNPFENYTSAVAFSPDAKTIAAGATDHRIHLFDSKTGQAVGQLVGTHWYPWTLAFTSDSQMLYSSGWDGTIRRWDIATRKQLDLPHGVRASAVVTASSNGSLLAYEDDASGVRLVDVPSGRELKRFEFPGLKYSQLLFSPDSRYLAGGGNSEQDVQVVIWDLASGDEYRHWTWPKGRDPHSQVEALSFSPDGRQIAAAVFRQSAGYIWDLPSNEQIARLKHNEIYGLSFSPDGKTLATAGWDSIVRFWDAMNGELRREFTVPTEKQDQGFIAFAVPEKGEKPDLKRRVGDLRMYAVCYAPERNLIATSHMNGEVWVWDATSMQPRMKTFVRAGFVYGALSFSPDGLWLATGTSDGSVRLWDPLTGQQVWGRGRHQTHVYTVGFGRDSRTLVSGGSDDQCYLWDLRPKMTRSGPIDLDQAIRNLSSDDGELAYQAMWDLDDAGEPGVQKLIEFLNPIESLVDPTLLDDSLTDEENERRTQMKLLLAKKDPKVEQTIVVRRAISLLGQASLPAAGQMLRKLAEREADDELRQFARSALSLQSRD